MQGHINRNDLANLTMWLIFLVMVAGIVLTQADGNVAVLLIGLAFVGGFGAATPNVWHHASRNQRRAVDDLEAALLTRFAVDD